MCDTGLAGPRGGLGGIAEVVNAFAPVPPDDSGRLVLDLALPAAQFLPGLVLALAIGFLIGIERGWRLRDEQPGGRVAGVRTFAILGLLGGLVGLESAFPLRILALLLAAGAIAALLLGYAADMKRDDNVSATSTLAGIVALGLGAMATAGHMALASVGAGATMILLASREPLHRAIASTSNADIKALLRLVLVVLVILPLLPDVGMGPWLALNPRRLWMVVVVTGSISFFGYVLSRWLGNRKGVLITAFVGAMVSSTAVTLDAARKLRDGSGGPAEEAGVAIASWEMLARALFLVAVLAPYALGPIALLVAPGIVTATAAAALLFLRRRPTEAGPAPPARLPGFGLALLFALSVALMSILSAWAEHRLGNGGGAIVIALGGTVDIDAAIAAVGALPPGSLPVRSVSLAIAAPILTNTLFKLAILLFVAGLRRARLAAAALAATSLALLAPLVVALP